MATLETFWQQLTRSAINKFLFWALSAITLLAGAYTIAGFDQPVDIVSARGIFLVALFIWGVNVLATWLHGENQEKRDDLTGYDLGLIGIAIIAVVAAALGFSAWIYIVGIILLIWVIVWFQSDTHYSKVDPMEATPRDWAAALGAAATVVFLLGVLGGYLAG